MIQHINANKVLILTDTVSREQKKDKKKRNFQAHLKSTVIAVTVNS